MKKGFYLFLLFVSVFMVSCDGLLWTGQSSASSDSLVLSINNPFVNDNLTPGGRALALQGDFLYIELARIDNSGAYTDPVSPFTTNGNWEETAWGGRAVLTFDLTDLATITATFKDVPRNQNISARVILDSSASSVSTGLGGGYTGSPPICHTYDSSGADIFEQLWVTITSAELRQNTVSLNIRPKSFSSFTWGASLNFSESYQSTTQTKPPVNSTWFFQVNPDISSLNLRDIGYYTLTAGTVTAIDSQPPSLAILYDNDGSNFSIPTPTVVFTNPNYSYRLLQVNVVSLTTNTSPDYFMGSTLYSEPSSTWDVGFGLLYDNVITADNFNSSLDVDWTLPTGLVYTDLEFRIIHIANTETVSGLGALEVVDDILAFSIDLDIDWNFYPTLNYWNGTFSAATDSWVIILARKPGGDPFIYGRTQAADLGT